MKKRIFSILLIFLFTFTSIVPIEASTYQDTEKLYQHNLEIYSSKSNNEELLESYKQISFSSQDDYDNIIDLAKSITEGKRSDYEKLKSIHDWVSNNIWYDYDSLNSIEIWVAGMALPTLKNKRGVCSGYARLTVILLRAAGIPAKSVTGYANGLGAEFEKLVDISSDETNHEWCEAYVDGRWVIIDTTWDSLNEYRNGVYSTKKNCRNKYFDISLKEISKSHRYVDYKEQYIKDGFAINPANNELLYTTLDRVITTEIKIPDGIEAIGDGVFDTYIYLKNIVIPNSVKSIGKNAFNHCSSLNEIFLPNIIENIGEGAFSSCYGLTDINLPANIKSIENRAFRNCTNLSEIVIPDSATSIGDLAFSGCVSLKSVFIPDSVTSIGDSAFDLCTSLKSITIPGSVTKIGKDLFFMNSDNDEPMRKIYMTSRDSIINSVTIYGEDSSYVESYAKDNGIKFFAGIPYDNVPNIDTASDWAKDGIKEAFAKRFIPDELQNNYKNYITRKEFCSIAVWFLEYKLDKDIFAIMRENGVSAGPSPFDDTMNFDVTVAYVLGIVNGTGKGKFSPNDTITREQAAKMIQNTCKLLGMNINNSLKSDFVDMKNASSWAIDGINFCHVNGIMSGTGNNNFSPKAKYTREQSILAFNNIK